MDFLDLDIQRTLLGFLLHKLRCCLVPEEAVISIATWVETVEVRMWVDTTDDGLIDQWSAWRIVTEQYDYIEGFPNKWNKFQRP